MRSRPMSPSPGAPSPLKLTPRPQSPMRPIEVEQPAPLPWGEVGMRSIPGEGVLPLGELESPHPSPLPMGEGATLPVVFRIASNEKAPQRECPARSLDPKRAEGACGKPVAPAFHTPFAICGRVPPADRPSLQGWSPSNSRPASSMISSALAYLLLLMSADRKARGPSVHMIVLFHAPSG